MGNHFPFEDLPQEIQDLVVEMIVGRWDAFDISLMYEYSAFDGRSGRIKNFYRREHFIYSFHVVDTMALLLTSRKMNENANRALENGFTGHVTISNAIAINSDLNVRYPLDYRRYHYRPHPRHVGRVPRGSSIPTFLLHASKWIFERMNHLRIDMSVNPDNRVGIEDMVRPFSPFVRTFRSWAPELHIYVYERPPSWDSFFWPLSSPLLPLSHPYQGIGFMQDLANISVVTTKCVCCPAPMNGGCPPPWIFRYRQDQLDADLCTERRARIRKRIELNMDDPDWREPLVAPNLRNLEYYFSRKMQETNWLRFSTKNISDLSHGRYDHTICRHAACLYGRVVTARSDREIRKRHTRHWPFLLVQLSHQELMTNLSLTGPQILITFKAYMPDEHRPPFEHLVMLQCLVNDSGLVYNKQGPVYRVRGASVALQVQRRALMYQNRSGKVTRFPQGMRLARHTRIADGFEVLEWPLTGRPFSFAQRHIECPSHVFSDCTAHSLEGVPLVDDGPRPGENQEESENSTEVFVQRRTRPADRWYRMVTGVKFAASIYQVYDEL